MRPVAGTGQVCRQLGSGDGPAILVADFQALNAAPRLSQLLTDAATGQRIYQVDPLSALSGDRLYATLPELADETAAFFRSGESSPSADQRVFVVSHCGAAGLALHIASRLSGAAKVTAILVQPTWPGTEHITERFAEFQAKLGAAGQPCPDLDGDPWSRVAELEQVMREGLTGLATRLGLRTPPLAFSELLASYRTWLAFLLACRNDQPAQAPTDEVAVSVLTNEPDFVLPGTDPGRCRIAALPPTERPDDVTPDLAKRVLDQIVS
ncbi:MAG: hypothetical protein QOE23_3867 [Pseudonocardiales bacterium]|jgi:hypothetical protein|nr:hypothetical protein [Pseudonocardiales bacterium]